VLFRGCKSHPCVRVAYSLLGGPSRVHRLLGTNFGQLFDSQRDLRNVVRTVAILCRVGSVRGVPPLGVHFLGTVDHKSRDPCFNVFLMEVRVMTFVALCTVMSISDEPNKI